MGDKENIMEVSALSRELQEQLETFRKTKAVLCSTCCKRPATITGLGEYAQESYCTICWSEWCEGQGKYMDRDTVHEIARETQGVRRNQKDDEHFQQITERWLSNLDTINGLPFWQLLVAKS